MPWRRGAIITSAVCALAFILAMAWSVAIERPRLAGSQICAQDAASAQLFGADAPGAYTFDRETGRAVRLPASMAFAMAVQGILHPSYPGQAACGMRALTRTADGLVATISLLGVVVGLLIAVVSRPRSAAAPASRTRLGR